MAHISLKWVVLLLGIVIAGAMVALVLVGTMTAREGVNDVVDALIDSVSEQATTEVNRFLVTPVELTERLVQMAGDKNLFNIERSDGVGVKDCVRALMILNTTDYEFAGSVYLATGHGFMCGLIEQTEANEFVTTTLPPIDQMIPLNPSWTIPCRYQRNCDNSSGHCVPENFWEPGTPPYWVRGEGTYVSDESLAYYLDDPLEPMYATWAVQQNPSQPSRTVCRPGATDSKPPCDSACPEFNRTYYFTDSKASSYSLKKTRAGYDPRSRSWYRNTAALALADGKVNYLRHYLDIYLCSSGFPCLSAVIPYFVKRPQLGEVISYGGMQGSVVGFGSTPFEMFSPVIDFTASGGGQQTIPTTELEWTSANGYSEHYAGTGIADYETTVLAHLFQKIKVAKTGSLFMIEKNSDALLISTGFPCPEAESQGLACFSKPQREDINGDPDRVSAFDSYGGTVPSKIMRELFNPITASHMNISSVTDEVVDIGSKYWVRIVPIQGKHGISGIDWLLLICIPQDDYLKTVNERNIVMLAVSLTLVMVLVGLLVLGTVVVFVKPMMSMTHHFDYACKMHLELIDSEERSCVSEMRFLQKCFGVLVGNLKLYKPFLPKSCLPFEVEEDANTESSATDMPRLDASRSCRSASSRVSSTIRSTATGTAVGGAYKMTNLTVGGLRNKRVTVLCCNVRNFRSLITAADLTTVHSQLFTQILRQIQTSKGVPEPFQGDRIMASYNAAQTTPVGLAQVRGLHAALAISQFKIEGGSVVCGVSCSDALCGILGTDTMRAHGIIGSAFGTSVILMNLTKVYNISVLFDGSFTENTRSRFLCRICDVLAKKKTSGRLHVWEAISTRSLEGDEEWMYQIDQVSDPHAINNRDWNFFLKQTKPTDETEVSTKRVMELAAEGIIGCQYSGKDPGYLSLEL